MITIEEFDSYIKMLGYIPACPTICVPHINDMIKNGKKSFKLFVNKHNLCYLVNDEFIKLHSEYEPSIIDRIFIINERDFKLAKIGIL